MSKSSSLEGSIMILCEEMHNFRICNPEKRAKNKYIDNLLIMFFYGWSLSMTAVVEFKTKPSSGSRKMLMF